METIQIQPFENRLFYHNGKTEIVDSKEGINFMIPNFVFRQQ